MSRRKRQLAIDATRALMAQRFPLAIKGHACLKQPLKIGIAADLIVAFPDLKPYAITNALRDYTHGPSYLVSMVAGASRIDLSGQPSGIVSTSDAEHAIRKLLNYRRFTRRKWLLLADRPADAERYAPLVPKKKKRSYKRNLTASQTREQKAAQSAG